MKRPKQRTRDLSTQNYRRSKLSYQNFTTTASKKTPSDKCRVLKKETDQLTHPHVLYPKLPISLSSTSWILFNQRTQQIIGFRQTNQREVASLTKIMTTIVSIALINKYQLDRDIAIRVSRTASTLTGTSAYLKYGKWLKLQDLLYGAMLPSGNDAAYLLAQVLGLLLFYERMKPEDKEYVDIQSIDITLYDNTIPFVNRFLKEMNRQAKQLKMYRTSFANPHGLANVLNFSTAKDMLELCKYACGNKDFRKIMNTEVYECQMYTDDFEEIYQSKVWNNTNKLLVKGWEGVKTGQTLPAGACLASVKDGVYIILLNCQNVEARFAETQSLYEWYISRDSETHI